MGAIVRRWERADWPTRRGLKSLDADMLMLFRGVECRV